MRLSRDDVEAQIPPHQDRQRAGRSSQPQIRRQVERICEAAGLEFEDLVELRIRHGVIDAIVYSRNEDGERYREENGVIAVQGHKISVDTSTFIGDERDI